MDEKQEIFTSTPEMTAGEMLHNARTTGRRKREISTIAKLLCIREEFLEALESGNYRVIPEDVYILGFARSYAVELGLDADEVIEKLKRELNIVSEKQETPEPEIKNETPKAKNKFNKEFFVKYFKTAFDYVKKHWVWFASGLGVVLVAVILLVVLLNTKNTTENQPSDAVSDQPVAVATVKVEPDFRFPVREKFNEKSAKESHVVLQAEKESWVKIEDARGNTVFSRVLVPGDVYYMPVSDKFKGTFGNAGGIDVWVDGQLVKKIGPANTRKTGVSMAPDALKAVGLAE
jgi:cytoskeletal protein RodZ